MSWVTNLMIHTDVREDRRLLRDLSTWLDDEAPRKSNATHGTDMRGVGSINALTAVNCHHWGGWKSPECNIWAGTLNKAELDPVMDRIASLPWQYPQKVQVFLMDQEQQYFRLYMLRGSPWRQYAPIENDQDASWHAPAHNRTPPDPHRPTEPNPDLDSTVNTAACRIRAQVT